MPDRVWQFGFWRNDDDKERNSTESQGLSAEHQPTQEHRQKPVKRDNPTHDLTQAPPMTLASTDGKRDFARRDMSVGSNHPPSDPVVSRLQAGCCCSQRVRFPLL